MLCYKSRQNDLQYRSKTTILDKLFEKLNRRHPWLRFSHFLILDHLNTPSSRFCKLAGYQELMKSLERKSRLPHFEANRGSINAPD